MTGEVSHLQKEQFLPCEELEDQQGDGCVEGKQQRYVDVFHVLFYLLPVSQEEWAYERA